jgi:hypothetical protein
MSDENKDKKVEKPIPPQPQIIQEGRNPNIGDIRKIQNKGDRPKNSDKK